MVKNLYDIVDKTAEKFLFKKKKFAQNKPKIKKIPNNVRKLLRKKLKLSKKLLSSENWRFNHDVKLKIENIEKELYQHYEDRRTKVEFEAISKIKSDPNHFYDYARRFSKDQSGIFDLKIKENIVSDDFGKANALQAQYKSVWSLPKNQMMAN